MICYPFYIHKEGWLVNACSKSADKSYLPTSSKCVLSSSIFAFALRAFLSCIDKILSGMDLIVLYICFCTPVLLIRLLLPINRQYNIIEAVDKSPFDFGN